MYSNIKLLMTINNYWIKSPFDIWKEIAEKLKNKKYFEYLSCVKEIDRVCVYYNMNCITERNVVARELMQSFFEVEKEVHKIS